MRHTIETAPRDGKVIILEDDVSGTYDVGHWSPEAGEWVGEKGEPSKITPTHWYPVLRDKYLLQEDQGSSNPSQVGRARRRLAASSITATLVAAALTGVYFRAEIAADVTRYAGQQDIFRISTLGPQIIDQATGLLSQGLRETYLLALQQQAEADQTGAQEVSQVQQIAVASVPEARQSFKEERAEAMAQEPTEARPAIEGLDVQLRAEAAKSAQSLAQEHEKTAALAQEAAAAQQELTASAAQHRQALGEERARGASLASELATARREIETQVALLRKADDETEQLKQAEVAKSARSRGQEHQKAAAVAQEVAAARQELTTSTAQHRQALDEERARSAVLAGELANAQHEIEMQAGQLRKAGDETEQLKQAEAAKSARSLEQEREKTTALAQEATARQALTASTAQYRQALDEERARRAALWSELAVAQREIETQAALLRKANDETKQLKLATESAMAELRQSLQQERDKTEAMARDLESTRRTVGARVTPEPAASSPTYKAAQAVEVAAVARPATVEAQGSPEATRLIARASALLGKGDIGAARIVLAHAAETGSPQASFMLAETYDPAVLSAWGTHGTRGEATKARALYAKAHAGGIQEAKTRFDALGQ
jgi:hypothetical protein